MILEERFSAESAAEDVVKGRVEGKVETQVEIAKNMLNMGIDLDIIKKATGLSMDEMKK